MSNELHIKVSTIQFKLLMDPLRQFKMAATIISRWTQGVELKFKIGARELVGCKNLNKDYLKCGNWQPSCFCEQQIFFVYLT